MDRLKMLWLNITTKKDLTYWLIGFMIYTYVENTRCLIQSEDLVNYVSFSSSILSIVLAVIAIIYSYIQTLTTDSVVEKLHRSTTVLETSSEKIKKTTEAFSNIQELPSKINESVKELTVMNEKFENVQELVKLVQKSVDEQYLRLDEIASTLDSNPTKELDNEIEAARLILNGTGTAGPQILYYVQLCYEKNKETNFNRFGKEILSMDNFFLLASGYLSPLKALGMIRRKKSRVTFFSQTLKAVIEEKQIDNKLEIGHFVDKSTDNDIEE